MTLRRIQRAETNLSVTRHRQRLFVISGVLILITVASLAIRGLNLGVEFTGGLVATVENTSGAAVTDVSDAIRSLGIEDVTVQGIDGDEAFRIQTPELGSETERELLDTVVDIAGSEPSSLEQVGPTFGALVLQRSLQALAVFLALATVFISWRLEFKMALAGMVALFHDLIITVGVYSVMGLPVTPATVIAVLTILGYSLYDTVVVFDKVDEIVSVESRAPYATIVDRAINIMLARSIATSLSTLIPVGSILVIGSFVLGAAGLTEFALALFVGIAAGTYSSLFLVGPLLAGWKEGEEEWEERRDRYGEVEVTADITDVVRQREREERERRRQGPPGLSDEVGRRRDR